jgi:hypothetical protein
LQVENRDLEVKGAEKAKGNKNQDDVSQGSWNPWSLPNSLCGFMKLKLFCNNTSMSSVLFTHILPGACSDEHRGF